MSTEVAAPHPSHPPLPEALLQGGLLQEGGANGEDSPKMDEITQPQSGDFPASGEG